MKKLKTFVIIGLLFFGFTGCSLDLVQILEHPDAVKPGETFTVLFTNIYIYASPYPTYLEDVSRDSVHVGIGLPANWTIKSAQFYFAENFRPLKLANGIDDTTAMEMALIGSLFVFQSRLAPLTADAGVTNYFSGKTFSATDTGGTSVEVVGDSVSKWFGYSGDLDMNLITGEKLDTFITQFDTTIDPISQAIIIDTVETGMTMIPIYLMVEIQTDATEGSFDLYYFSKTAALPIVIDSTAMDFDIGNMATRPITVSATAGIQAFTQSLKRGHQLAAYPNPFVQNTHIQLNMDQKSVESAAIYNSRGQRIKLFRQQSGKKNLFSIQWDGRNDLRLHPFGFPPSNK